MKEGGTRLAYKQNYFRSKAVFVPRLSQTDFILFTKVMNCTGQRRWTFL